MPTPTSYYDEVISDGPLSYILCDDTSGAVDDQGYAAFSGWATYLWSSTDPSLIRDGTGSWGLQVGNQVYTYDSFNSGGFTTDYTIEMWVEFDAAPDGTTSDYGLWSMGSYDQAYLTISENIASSGNRMNFQSYSESADFGDVSDIFDSAPHHIVLVYSSSLGTIELFIDGTSRGTGSCSTPGWDSFNANYWGSANFGSWGMRGSIDELAIYDYALDSSRIGIHWNAGKPTSGGGTPPANTSAPAVTGTATRGQTLSCSTGSWSNSPTSYSYQWYRGYLPGAGAYYPGAEGALYEAISGATSSTYVLAQSEVRYPIFCAVTATNADGSVGAASNTTSNVAHGPYEPFLYPPSTVAIAGTPVVAETLTLTNIGDWSGYDSLAVKWQRDGVDISGETTESYVLAGIDVGKNIRAVVTATNTYGSASSNSNALGPVTGGSDPSNVWIRVSGAWVQSNMSIKSSGAWVSPATSKIRNGGVWV